MAEELQHLPGSLQIALLDDLKRHSQLINNLIILLARMIYNLKKIERFRTFVKHHSTVEKYIANKYPIWMVLRDRWEGLNGAESWE
jgi:hypothetical protein